MTLPNSTTNLPLDGQHDARIRVEFAINVDTQDRLNEIVEVLETKGVKVVSSDISTDASLKLEFGHETISELRNIDKLQKFIEAQSGVLAVVKGTGQLNSAVAELRPPRALTGEKVMGLARLSQLDHGFCFVDVTVHGYKPSLEGKSIRNKLAIHEFGDLTGENFETIGDVLVDIDDRPVKSIDHDISIAKTISNCDVLDIIGKSIAFTERSNESKRTLSAGIIARASTVDSNKKRICSCSGKTLWEERVDSKKVVHD